MKFSVIFRNDPKQLLKTLRNISVLDNHSNQPIHNDTFKIFDYGYGEHIGVGLDKNGAVQYIFELPKEVDVQQLGDNQSITEAYKY